MARNAIMIAALWTPHRLRTLRTQTFMSMLLPGTAPRGAGSISNHIGAWACPLRLRRFSCGVSAPAIRDPDDSVNTGAHSNFRMAATATPDDN